GKDEGNCREDTRDSGGRTIVLRVTPDEVNSAGDADDLDPGDGHCDTGSNIARGSREEPECPLRAAIQEANAAGGSDITFDIATPPPYVISPGSPLPALEAPMTIRGPMGAGKAGPIPAPQIT